MPATRAGDDLVVIVAGTSWDGPWLPERHVALQLAQRVRVLWVDPPISYLTPLRDRASLAALREERLREVAANILRLSPITVPGVTRPLLREVASRQARRAVRRAVRSIGGSVRSVIVASLDDMLDVVPCDRRLFYGTDDFCAGAELMGTDRRWLERRERRQLARADVVVAVSPVLQEKWSARGPAVELIPNGCDAPRFATVDDAARPADVQLPGPIAGFVGHMSERIDLTMLEAVADSGVSLLLVGPRQPTFAVAKLDALLARRNVQWVGPKPFEEMPSYMRMIDVGLTPYRQSDFNRASFPLKTLEYLAAGRPAVATDLPAHRWLDTPHIAIVQTPQDAARQTQALLSAPRRPSDVRERRALGERHSWAARGADIARLIGLDEREAACSRAAGSAAPPLLFGIGSGL